MTWARPVAVNAIVEVIFLSILLSFYCSFVFAFLFVFSFLVYFFMYFVSSVPLSGDDVLYWLLSSCPFPSVSNLVLGLICFGSVYLATTACFVTDQLM